MKTPGQANDAAVKKIGDDLAALTTRLSNTPAPGGQQRPQATGGDTAIVTDC